MLSLGVHKSHCNCRKVEGKAADVLNANNIRFEWTDIKKYFDPLLQRSKRNLNSRLPTFSKIKSY